MTSSKVIPTKSSTSVRGSAGCGVFRDEAVIADANVLFTTHRDGVFRYLCRIVGYGRCRRADAGSVSPRRPRTVAGADGTAHAALGLQHRAQSGAQPRPRRRRRGTPVELLERPRHRRRSCPLALREALTAAGGTRSRRVPHARGRRPELRRDCASLRTDTRCRPVAAASCAAAAAPGTWAVAGRRRQTIDGETL